MAVMLMHEIGIFRPGLGPQFHAGIAVDLFFMLSGFVLAYAYDDRLDKGMGWREFMAARLIRLYPMLAFAILLSAGVALLKLAVQHVSEPGEALWLLPAGLLLLPTGLFLGEPGAFSTRYDLVAFGGPAWSLLFELVASAAFATGLRRPGRYGPLLFTSGAAILIGLTIAAGQINLLGTQGYIGVPGGLVRVGVAFAIGVFLFRHRVPDRLPRLPVLPTLIVGGLLCLLPIENTTVFDLVCVFALLPLVIGFGAQPVASATLRQWCIWLGRLSYPVYLLHVPVSRIVGFVAKAILPSIGATTLIALSMIAAILGSWAVLRWFDEPLRRWLGRQWAAPAGPGPQTEARR